MENYEILVLLIAGIISGMVNTIAGGGSLLTLPILIFLGLPPSIANGTNRIQLIFQKVILPIMPFFGEQEVMAKVH